jgi:hypothetical protein
MERRTAAGFDETRILGRLPNVDIQIVHRAARDGEDECLTVTMRAVPSFEAVGRMLEAANPMLFWTQMMRAAWSPWMGILNGWAAPGRIRQKW